MHRRSEHPIFISMKEKLIHGEAKKKKKSAYGVLQSLLGLTGPF